MKAKGTIKINADWCKGCTWCVISCPKKVIRISGEINAGGYYPAVFQEDGDCTGCAQCALMCPEVAIEVYRE